MASAKCACFTLMASLLSQLTPLDGGCTGKCCKGRDFTCTSTDWRMDRVYGICFCDETCRQTGDCCFDYPQTCPARACVVSQWSHWSGCAQQCKPAYRIRHRAIEQEPENGGVPCPPLEEKAGCLEYTDPEGRYCALNYGHAFITSMEYSEARRKRDLPYESKNLGYCVQYKIETLSDHCTHESRPFARWMQYLREGFTVCVFCQPPALNMDYQACQGDGANFDGNETLQWQAVGNTKCRGTWRKVRRVEQCSCPVVHSFLFT
uniref:Somatomedin B and thrombospondin type 1 domain containing n=1 Tax=Erpetoichthys calabaricus TaxID=27687 RepID=A0A8C4X6M4_ERPCA